LLDEQGSSIRDWDGIYLPNPYDDVLARRRDAMIVSMT
jgi:hypothetical protein